MQTDLTKGRPIGVILKFAIPLLLGNIFQQLYNMVDTIIVGHYVGQNALAAVGSTGTIMFLVLGFAQGLTTGFTVLTSQRYGAGDARGTKISVANGILLAAATAIFVTLVSVASMRWVLHVMNTPEAIFEDAYAYISVICIGTTCSIFYNLFSSYLRAVGDSRTPLLFLIFSAGLNVVLDMVFIIGLKMGTAGAAWATNVAQGISAVLCLLFIIKKMPILTPERDMWKLQEYATKHQLSTGLPMALQFAITASGTMIMQAAINLFGATAVAAYTAASKVQNLITQGFATMGQAMASYCGQNYGSGQVERIHKGVRSAVITMTIYALAAAVLVMAALEPLMGIFFERGTDMSAMMPYARTYALYCVIFYIPLGYIFIFRNAMQGCGYGFLPMVGGIVELFCRTSMAVLAIRLMSYNLAAFCDPFAWLGAGIFTTIAFRVVLRKVERTFKTNGTETSKAV